MGPNLTEKQLAALKSLAAGPAPIAIKHFGALRAAGFVQGSLNAVAKRGYAGAILTAAGRAKLEG